MSKLGFQIIDLTTENGYISTTEDLIEGIFDKIKNTEKPLYLTNIVLRFYAEDETYTDVKVPNQIVSANYVEADDKFYITVNFPMNDGPHFFALKVTSDDGVAYIAE